MVIDPANHPGAAPRIWQYLAWSLIGRPVPIYFRVPSFEAAVGQFHRQGNREWIEIHPNLGQEGQFDTFLEEVAHAFLHQGDTATDQAILSLLPEIDDPDRRRAGMRDLLEYQQTLPHEAEAKALARQWRAAVDVALGEDATIESRLAWLLDAAYDNDLEVINE